MLLNAGAWHLGVPVVRARLAQNSRRGLRPYIRDASDVTFLSPNALRMLKREGAEIAGPATVFASGGKPLGQRCWRRGRQAFGLSINEFYGQTECNMVATSAKAASFHPARIVSERDLSQAMIVAVARLG